MKRKKVNLGEGYYPDNSIRVSCNDNILCVPLVHLWHTAAEDLLAAAGEGVGAGDGASINAPHMDVGASTGHDITLHPDRVRIKSQNTLVTSEASFYYEAS